MNNRPTTLHLPAHLPFPITISSLLASPQDPIRKHDGLLVYKFYALESEEQDDDSDAPKQVTKEIFEQFDSPWEGIFHGWLVEEGTVVASARCAIPACCNCCERSADVVCVQSTRSLRHRTLSARNLVQGHLCHMWNRLVNVQPRLTALTSATEKTTPATSPLNPTSPCPMITLTSKSPTMYCSPVSAAL